MEESGNGSMNPKVIALAQAIAKAEGFGVDGALPTRCHNPGDLEVGDVGYGTDEGKTIFSEDQDGWMALEHQCDLMLTGNSHVYKPSMNFLQIAQLYTGGDNAGAWAQIVAQSLGISVTMTLYQFYNPTQQEAPNA
jgi:hypothetical protein